MEYSIKTCQGQGEVFAYHTTPMQNIKKNFVTTRNELYIFTRSDYISNLDVRLNGVLTPKTTVISTTLPFRVKVYRVNTSPGDVVSISDSSSKDSRAIQWFLTQEVVSRAFNIENINIVFDESAVNNIFLLPGNFSYLIFDKYSQDPPGNNPDNRKLFVKIEDDSSNVVVDRNYTKPVPVPAEGVILDNYSISSTGNYKFEIDTEDSVYWFLLNCSLPCEDLDNDGVCDEDDSCRNSKPNELIDKDGCDPFQFCSQFSCGYDCFYADFMGNEPGVKYPQDCTVVIPLKNGKESQPVCVPTEVSDVCFG